MTRRQRCGTTRPRPACRHWRATPTTSGVARGGVTAQLLLGVAPARLQPTRHFPTHFGCSCVAFHPQLPIIPTGSEDGAVGWCPAQTHINTHNSHTRSHLKLRRVPPGAAHHPDRLRGRRRQDVARDHVQVRLAEAVSCGFRTKRRRSVVKRFEQTQAAGVPGVAPHMRTAWHISTGTTMYNKSHRMERVWAHPHHANTHNTHIIQTPVNTQA